MALLVFFKLCLFYTVRITPLGVGKNCPFEIALRKKNGAVLIGPVHARADLLGRLVAYVISSSPAGRWFAAFFEYVADAVSALVVATRQRMRRGEIGGK